MLVVETPGLFTTVQDLGRPGHVRHGISAAGAADTVALRIANRLVGNPDDAAVLEMLLTGGSFRFEEEALVACSGADMGATLDGARLAPATAAAVRPGSRLAFGSARDGARTWLAVSGGIAVPAFLGSRSTHVPSGIGGLEGRALRKGNRLPIGAARGDARRLAEAPKAPSVGLARLRVTEGIDAPLFAPADVGRLHDSTYVVGESSNRSGLRLGGPRLRSPGSGETFTRGMPLGAVQIPPGGEPLVLFVDQQTTGGYPVIACVISADRPRLAQLRPRDQVRFEAVTFERARSLLLEQEAWLERVLPRLA